MKRVVGVVGVAFATLLGTASPASAAPSVQPVVGGVIVTATFGDLTQTIAAGTIVATDTDNGRPGLCAVGDVHTSCTPADEAAG